MAGTNIREVLYSILTSDATIPGLLGAADNVFPSVAPTAADLPYITYEIIASPTVRHMGGASGIVRDTFQIDCYATSPDTAFAVSEAVREALDGYQRTLDGSVYIQSMTIRNQRTDFIKPDDGSEIPTYRRQIDIDIWHGRSVPTF